MAQLARPKIIDTNKFVLKPNPYSIFIPMSYGSSLINTDALPFYISADMVKSIQIVYTNFPIDADLTQLNNSRQKSINKLIPRVLQKLGTVSYIKQNKCKNEQEAKKLFHGIVIELIEPLSSYKKGSYFLSNYLDGKTQLKSDLVSSILSRNETWKDMAIVCDFTGSMTPYVADLLLWLKIQDRKQIKGLIFFNDGDSLKTHEKIITRTGGIYSSKSFDFDTLSQLAFRCTKAGDGGDLPENDIEALLSAEKTFPDAQFNILIADNAHPPRDYMFANKLTKPVKIILCVKDPYDELHPFYLNLAIKTKGSIHTITDDLMMNILQDGDKFTYKGINYKMINGELKKSLK